jgi:hypothetical protein
VRSAVANANNAYNQATNTANELGAEGQGIGSNLTPFLTQEMLHPQGLGQEGIGAETSAALGGAGGANSAFNGEAAQRAAVSRNAGGYAAALADAARSRDKAAAGASEGIQAQNENLKQQQMQEGAGGLEHMYGTDTSGMLNAMNQEHEDINSAIEGNKTGWLQNTLAIMSALNPGGKVGGFTFGGGH